MPQNQRHQNPAQNWWWYKTYVKKEMMAIEKIENTEAVSKSPPKKGNPGVKTKSKGTPFAP